MNISTKSAEVIVNKIICTIFADCFTQKKLLNMKRILKLIPVISLFVLILFASCAKNEPNVATNITLNKSTSYLIIGQTDSLLVTMTTSSGDTKGISQTWSTSNSAVASVQNGVVIALTAGTSTITVTSGTKSANCVVTVDDKILPAFTQGELDYFGDAYSTKISNNFVIYLASSGIDMSTFQGNGELMSIELNTSLSDSMSIPVGTYDMMTDYTKITNYIPLSLVPANIDSNNYPLGCWYFGIFSDPISLGNIVVSKVNAIYTITYEFYDDYGVKISGNYNGTLSYLDATKSSAVKSAKSRMHLNSVSHLTKNMKFKRR
jgi:hypothetical protein